MKFTDNYNLNLPDLADQYNLEHWNENTSKIDEQLKVDENNLNSHKSDLKNPHQVKGSQLVEPVPTEKIADLSIVTSKIADKNVTVEKLAQAIQQCLSPTGTIRTGLWKTAPDGWLLCDGSKVLISDYPNLYQCAVDNGWGTPDGSGFYLPNLTGRFLQGGTVGQYKEAGLPNITGEAYIRVREGTSTGESIENVSGAFTRGSTQRVFHRANATSNNEQGTRSLKIDASLASSIYGNSSTVQPPSYCITYIIKY